MGGLADGYAYVIILLVRMLYCSMTLYRLNMNFLEGVQGV